MPDRRRAWARALFDAAPDQMARSAYGDALEAIALAIEADERFHAVLIDPATTKEAKASLLVSALDSKSLNGGAQGEAAAIFNRFCSLVVEKGRAALLVQIASSFGKLRDADEGIARLEIEAARTPDPATVEKLGKAWNVRSGATSTRTSVRVNPGLIAGYRLRSGSLRIDYSVAGRLERLRRELAQPLDRLPSQGQSEATTRGEG